MKSVASRIHENLQRNEDDNANFRVLSGPLGMLQRFLFCCIPVLGILFILGIHTRLGWGLYAEQYVGLFLSIVFVTIFFSKQAVSNAPRDRLPWYDVILVVLSLPIGLYLAFFYPQVAFNLGVLTLERTICGVLTILLIIEAVRRFAGWTFVIVICSFILYGRFANLCPEPFCSIGTNWVRLVDYLYVDPNSILSQLNLAAGIALAFIFFGNVLSAFRGTDHIANLAIAALGKLRGGSAKASVGMSCLVGTITGGCTTNVMITGTITIPLMIKAGYTPAYAAAVESVASSGGGIMPPVMGIIAFMIAENLGIPYADVAIAALIPAFLFYIALFIQVDLESGKNGFQGIPRPIILQSVAALREGWVIVPCLFILVYTLMIIRLNPSTAGVYSSFLAIPFLLIAPRARGNFWKNVLTSLEKTGIMLMNISALVAGAGIIIGVVSVSGFGFNIAYTLTSLSNNNLFLLLFIAAVTSVILGMGMPPVPAYALVGTLVAPALVGLGILPLAAHLFILYFATVANWTPPVALACFAASSLSNANPNKIGLIAMRLGILAYIIPFLFVYSPALILNDANAGAILFSVITAIIGAVVLGVGLAGYFCQFIPASRRLLFCLSGAALLIPFHKDLGATVIMINAAGFVIAVLLLFWELFTKSQKFHKDLLNIK